MTVDFADDVFGFLTVDRYDIRKIRDIGQILRGPVDRDLHKLAPFHEIEALFYVIYPKKSNPHMLKGPWSGPIKVNGAKLRVFNDFGVKKNL